MSVFYNKEGIVILETGSGKIKLKNSSKYSIGDSVDGGIVFYTYGNPIDGFKAIIARQIATPEAALLPWGGIMGANYYVTQATGTTIGTGLDNTLRIVDNDPTRPIVASEALDYLPSPPGNPWYLPSKDELSEIYKNKNLFGNKTSTHWSSSESTNDTDEVWVRRFSDGAQWESSKASGAYNIYFQIKTILG